MQVSVCCVNISGLLSLNSRLTSPYTTHTHARVHLQNLLISSMSGVSPRAYPLIELAIAPLVGAIEWGFLLWADYVAAAYGRRCSASAVVGDGAAAEAVPNEEKAHAT